MKLTRHSLGLPAFALPTLATGTLAFGAAALVLDGMGTKYVEGASYSVSYSTSATTETESETFIDGERVEGRGFGGGARETSFGFGYTDQLVAVADGAPTKVKRSFEEVGAKMSMEMRGEPMEIELDSPFNDVTLLLELKEGVVEATVEDGDAPDAERLEGHSMRLMLDGLLPGDDVETGASWDIEADALEAALGGDLRAKLLERPEMGGGGEGRGQGRGGRGGAGRMLGGEADRMFGEDYEWAITGTLTDQTEEFGGVECKVIEIEGEMSGELPERGGRGGRGGGGGRMVEPTPAGTLANTITAKVEGTLLWNPKTEMPVKLALEGTIETETSMSRDTQRGSFESNSSSTTTMKTTVEVSAGAADDE